MCFELDSLPPIPPIEGGAVDHRELVLESSDANRFAAFAALPEEPSGNAVVVLPDVRGLSPFYEELALRFAERGIAAVAIDYYGRTAGADKRVEEFDYMTHFEQLTPEGIEADVRAGVGWIQAAGGTSIFAVGFCLGGRCAWLAAADGHGLAGAVGFYGVPGEREYPGPVQRAGEIDAPILALQAGADEKITAADNAEFEEALTAAGVEYELVTYPGAPHSFFDRRHEEFADDSADAWRRVLAFVERYGV